MGALGSKGTVSGTRLKKCPSSRAGLQETGPPIEQERIRLDRIRSTNCSGVAAAEKHRKTLLDGEPQFRGIQFSKRHVPRRVAAKYGERSVANVEPLPVSFDLAEPYKETRNCY